MIQKSPYIGINRTDICVRRWLDRQFPGHWTGLRAPMLWPPRPPDLMGAFEGHDVPGENTKRRRSSLSSQS